MQSETGFPSSHQLKSYVASKSRLKLAARAVLSADAGLLVLAGSCCCKNLNFLWIIFTVYITSANCCCYGSRPWPRRLCVRWGPSSPPQKGHGPSI